MRKLAAVAVLALTAGCATAGASHTAAAAGCPVLAAHKGMHWPYWGMPENSLGAIDAAARNHAPWVETDTAVARDSNIVIMHGGVSFHDLTGRAGTPAGYTTAQLTAMRLRDAPGMPFTGQHLPTLWQYLQRAKADHERVEVEGSASWTGAQFAMFIRRLKGAGARWFARVSGTSPAFLARVRAAYPGMATDLLVAPYWPLTGAGTAGSVQADVAVADPRYPAWSPPSLLASLRGQHAAIDLWTPDDTAAIRAALAIHPDMVTTDNLTLFHRLSGCP
jgi:glycerophosphoryl diester phosphodiesterase